MSWLQTVVPRLAAALLLPLAVLPAAAQSPKLQWDAGPARAGFCIHFLLAPQEAARGLPSGYGAVSLRDGLGLPAALSRTIEEDPRYAEWVPSRFCAYYVASMTAANRSFDGGDGDRPFAFGYWAVLASSPDDPRGGGAGVGALRLLGSNNSGFKKLMETQLFPTEWLDLKQEQIRESNDTRYTIKFEKTTLVFDGHPSPDSSLVQGAVADPLVLSGERRGRWRIDAGFQPARRDAFPGSLRVQGKGDLAKALVSSPIRLVGPVLTGGTGTVVIF